jgi:hypothetical protein
MSARYWRAALVIWVLALGHDAVAQTPSLSLSGGSGAPGASVYGRQRLAIQLLL